MKKVILVTCDDIPDLQRRMQAMPLQDIIAAVAQNGTMSQREPVSVSGFPAGRSGDDERHVALRDVLQQALGGPSVAQHTKPVPRTTTSVPEWRKYVTDGINAHHRQMRNVYLHELAEAEREGTRPEFLDDERDLDHLGIPRHDPSIAAATAPPEPTEPPAPTAPPRTLHVATAGAPSSGSGPSGVTRTQA